MDFANPQIPLPTHISTLGGESCALQALALVTVAYASYNWPAQYRAVYVPIEIEQDFPVARVFACNGSSPGGNWDFGIYGPDGSQIHASSFAAGAGANTLVYNDVTDFLLTAGSYYFALSNDSATVTNRAYGASAITTNEGRIAGLLQENIGSPGRLLSPATFAQWASTGIPICGVTRTASGF